MQNRVGSFLVSLAKKGKKLMIGLVFTVGDADEAMVAVAISALSNVVLPDPYNSQKITGQSMSRSCGLIAPFRV